MPKTAFTNCSLFIGDGRVVESGLVIIEDDKIIGVESSPLDPPEEAEVIDLTGAMLLPGLIDCHVHICHDGSADPWAARQGKSVPDLTLIAAEHARKTLMGGVTTIRDMGASNGIDLALRQAWKTGLIAAPRMLVSGPCICMTGGHGWRAGREADGPDEVRKAAREHLKLGVDQVKLMATGGVMTPGVEPGSEQFTEAELRAGIEEAHKAGRLTATHAQGGRGIKNALRAGIDSIEHGIYLDDEAIELFQKTGAYLCPTLSAAYNIVAGGTAGGVPEFAVRKTEKVIDIHRASMTKAFKAGVRIGLGTDAGTPFNRHGANLKELVLMTENGMSPTEALTAATKTAADLIGLGDQLGLLAPGRLADLVACVGNPVDRIELLTDPDNISLIYQNGKRIK